MYKLAATNRYTWNYIIYSGEQYPTAAIGHAKAIVMNLLDDPGGCYRTVVADNFFTNISLAKHLLEHDKYLIGTVRANCVRSGSKVLQKNLRRGEAYALQNKDGVKLIKWKDKKDILMISTKPSHSATVADTGNINSKNERIRSHKLYWITTKEDKALIYLISYQPITRASGGQSNGTERWHLNWFLGQK